MRIAVMPGDGIGAEIVPQAVKVLEALKRPGLSFEFEEVPVGGEAIELSGEPLPRDTLRAAEAADAILFGAVGAPKYDHLPNAQKPGFALRSLRKHFGLYSNLRPVRLVEALIDASTLKPDVVRGLDLLIIRELNGDIYYGVPRGISTSDGQRIGVNTMHYTEAQIERIAHDAFSIARGRGRKVCSIDKSNVLETMQLWREVVTEVGRSYPDVALTHMLVDSAAMMLVRDPKRFDVILTPNLFGDILSDQASMLTGSIGLLPSASLGQGSFGLYEPIHGSAPDIAGLNIANPIATILSSAMMLRYSLDLPMEADRVEAAVLSAVNDGLRTSDIARPGELVSGTVEAGEIIIDALR